MTTLSPCPLCGLPRIRFDEMAELHDKQGQAPSFIGMSALERKGRRGWEHGWHAQGIPIQHHVTQGTRRIHVKTREAGKKQGESHLSKLDFGGGGKVEP